MKSIDRTVAHVLRKEKKVLVGYLYGSTARGTARVDSDIDVAVVLKAGTRIPLRYPERLAILLEQALAGKRIVDVRILNETPVRFRFHVLKEGRRVFERNPRERVQFETYATQMYYDMKPMHDLYESLRARRYGI